MLLNLYIGLAKIKLLKKEVESLTSGLPKTMPHWLISKNQLKKQ